LNTTIRNFLVSKKQENYKRKFFEILSEFYYTKFIDMKNTTVNIMINLINYKEQEDMEMLLNFLKKLHMNTKAGSLLRSNSEIIETKDDFKDLDLEGLSLKTKKRLVQAIFEADYFNIKLKNELWQIILGENFNDKYFKFTLEAAQPDKDKKKAIWKKLVFETGREKSKINQAYMKSFAAKSQYSLMKNYFHEKFFQDFTEVRNKHSTDYCIKFFNHLKPTFIIQDDIMTQLDKLKVSLDRSDYQLINEVDRGKLLKLKSFLFSYHSY